MTRFPGQGDGDTLICPVAALPWRVLGGARRCGLAEVPVLWVRGPPASPGKRAQAAFEEQQELAEDARQLLSAALREPGQQPRLVGELLGQHTVDERAALLGQPQVGDAAVAAVRAAGDQG